MAQAVASRVGEHGETASIGIRDGRSASTEAALWRSVDQEHLSCAPAAIDLERTEDGRAPTPALGTRRAGKLCGVAVGQGSGQSELHQLSGEHRLASRAVRTG